MEYTKTPILWQCDYLRQCQLVSDVASTGHAYFEALFRILSRLEGPPANLEAFHWVMCVMVVPELLEHFLNAFSDEGMHWKPLSRVHFRDHIPSDSWITNSYSGLSFRLRKGGIYMCRYYYISTYFGRHTFPGWHGLPKSEYKFLLNNPGPVYRCSDGRLYYHGSKFMLTDATPLAHNDEQADLQERLLDACCTRLKAGGFAGIWVGVASERHCDGYLQYILPWLAQVCNTRARMLINEAM